MPHIQGKKSWKGAPQLSEWCRWRTRCSFWGFLSGISVWVCEKFIFQQEISLSYWIFMKTRQKIGGSSHCSAFGRLSREFSCRGGASLWLFLNFDEDSTMLCVPGPRGQGHTSNIGPCAALSTHLRDPTACWLQRFWDKVRELRRSWDVDRTG